MIGTGELGICDILMLEANLWAHRERRTFRHDLDMINRWSMLFLLTGFSEMGPGRNGRVVGRWTRGSSIMLLLAMVTIIMVHPRGWHGLEFVPSGWRRGVGMAVHLGWDELRRWRVGMAVLRGGMGMGGPSIVGGRLDWVEIGGVGMPIAGMSLVGLIRMGCLGHRRRRCRWVVGRSGGWEAGVRCGRGNGIGRREGCVRTCDGRARLEQLTRATSCIFGLSALAYKSTAE